MNLRILSAGGHGKVVADAAWASGAWADIGFLDDRYPTLTRMGRWPVLGSMLKFTPMSKADRMVVALGSASSSVGDTTYDSRVSLGNSGTSPSGD